MQGAGKGDNVLCPTLFCGRVEEIVRLFVRRSGRIGRFQVAVIHYAFEPDSHTTLAFEFVGVDGASDKPILYGTV